MKLVDLITLFQMITCQAYIILTNKTAESTSIQNVNGTASKEINRKLFVLQHAEKCSWSLPMPEKQGDGLVALTAEFQDELLVQICQSLGCGGVYSLEYNQAPPNTTCQKACTYQDRQLQNCTDIVASDCRIISEVVCGHQAVRLTDGNDRCAGRVELWRDGEWGTVCDDQWDLREANVVCGQLGCGYAISVSGQGGSYPQGSGPIHLDELNCTGTESNLWACPALKEGHDCGHKEDAGMVCSEMQAVRLSGGLDHCSGKVEIHHNGTWGTVCDHCWELDMASMVCRMLGCGNLTQFSQFNPHFEHNNGTLSYYICSPPYKDLWQCKRLVKVHLCQDSHAAAVICTDSLGLPKPNMMIPTSTYTEHLPVGTTSPIKPGKSSTFPWSLELLVCVALSFILLISLMANAMFCCTTKSRDALLVQQRHDNLQTTYKHHENDYRDSDDIHLIKVTTSPSGNDALPELKCLWTQLSSGDSTSLDTDYEPCDPSLEPTSHLFTFRNSKRYRPDEKNPTIRGSEMDIHLEEAPCLRIPETNANQLSLTSATHYDGASGNLTRTPSENSFDSSSTSSGESYENTRAGIGCMEPPEERQTQQSSVYHNTASVPCTENPNQLQSGQLHFQEQDYTCEDEEDDPLYSPVSPDPHGSSSDSIYDDVRNQV